MAKLAWRYADTFEFMEQTRAGFPPAMICVAINGGIQGKETHDRLPESPDEIADAALPDVASLNLTPDMSRFTMKARPAPLPNPRGESELDVCIPFTYGIIEQFAGEMMKRGIKPEMETYHTGGAWVIRDLIERRLVEPPYLVQTVMGAQTASYPTPENVLQLLKELPDQSVWLCSGIGPFQLPLTTLALLMGGHARVGLEDNLYHSRGRKFIDNAESVRRVARIAAELNRKISTPAETRKLLGLPAVPLR
jgi:3-keto-5-aminohexanoate cleavage enzyme